MILPSPLIALATAVLLSATSSGLGYLVGHGHGSKRVQQQWDHQMARTAEEMARQQAKAREAERQLQRQTDQKLQEKARENAALARRAAALADSLRQRADRPADSPAGVPQVASAGVEPATGCTGSQLYRQDGEFLAREAARADQLRIALRTCIADRAEIERQLN